MRKQLFAFLLVLLALPLKLAAQDIAFSSDKEEYRRSSLCLILLTHKDKKYAEEMERIFQDFPMPARYNEHNIVGFRCISVRGKQSKAGIEKMLKQMKIGQKLVERWFNRNESTGAMDMDLIHDRGGYGAMYADYERAKETVRGTAMLRDEGVELLQSTFVLVCDMDYIDKAKRAGWAAFGMGLLSLGMQVGSAVSYSQAQSAYARGDYRTARSKESSARAWNAGSLATAGASRIVADIGGFRVKLNAYLFKLNWDDEMTERMYSNYWVDETTSAQEADTRRRQFENDANLFTMKFVGQYKATSSKTILRSWKNEDEVIKDVCYRCVAKGVKELSKKFVVFRPRTPYYFEGKYMYSHIGTKEDVRYGKKYEIVQRTKDKKGNINYKKVGLATAGTPWNNRDIRFDEYFDPEQKGTRFTVKSSKVDLWPNTGLQLREL
ncbi:MAG: hypothetical protein MSH66_02140 [Bacteroidales bacterium]|nr:hypothetical protein [Bacteroidales bacterium]